MKFARQNRSWEAQKVMVAVGLGAPQQVVKLQQVQNPIPP